MDTIALITDFGSVDGFVGTMKGVIASIAPRARIIDISHESIPHQSDHAAFILWSSYKYFSEKSVFVVIVDPGVGTERRIILIEDGGGKKYIVPENGILRFIIPELQNPKAYHINNPEYWLSDVSSTFHGRDIFAPVAAHLVNGVPCDRLGTGIELSIPESPFVDIDFSPVEKQGKIVYSDRFGNLITNFRPTEKPPDLLDNFSIDIGDRTIGSLKRTYGYGEYGELIAVIGSSGLIEIAVRNSSARQMLGLRIGDTAVVRIKST
jgi:S-adenosyl-L-methionine hydrolase (adenosine-forming)